MISTAKKHDGIFRWGFSRREKERGPPVDSARGAEAKVSKKGGSLASGSLWFFYEREHIHDGGDLEERSDIS